MTLGSLVVTLEANIAKFASDLGRAVTMAEASMNQISRAVSKASDALKFLGAGFGVYEVISFSKEVLHAAAELEGLHMQTGLSITALSAMSNEATKAGDNVQDVALAFNRLEKSAGMAAGGGNKKLEEQFNAIGISSKRLAEDLKDPDRLALDVAASLEKYADNAYKADVATALMGRGGAQFLEVLHLLAVDGLSAATATETQVKQAKAFEVALAGVSIKIKALALDFLTVLIPAVTITSATWENRFDELWIRLKAGSKINMLTLKQDLTDLDDFMITKSGNAVRKLFGMAPRPMNEDNTKKIKDLKDSALAEIAANDAILKSAQDKYAGIGKAEAVKDTRPDAPLISKATKLPAGQNNDGLIKAMDERLKIIDAAIKREDEALKLSNQLIDADYKNGLIDLADYGTQRFEQMRKNYSLTQSLYDAEIALAQSYVTRIEKELAKEKRVKVDPEQQGKQDARIAAKQAELEQAQAKASQIDLTKYTDQIKYQESLSTQTEKLIGDSNKYAGVLINLDIAYATLNGDLVRANSLQATQSNAVAIATLTTAKDAAGLEKIAAIEERRAVLAQRATVRPINDMHVAYLQMIGDTAKATELQIDLDDETTKYALSVLNATDSLKELAAIEDERRLRASQNGFDGMTRAIKDYQKGLADVAKQTEAMTTKMLTGMEDALVSFVTTGKLNWKGLINSMIADIARLLIRQQIMGSVSNWMGLAMSALGGGAGIASTGAGAAGMSMDATASAIPAFAGGGAVNQGQRIMVGERGPEQFVPSVQGSITPNGGGTGAPNVTYAPTIQIDSRSDRAQVQKDTAELLRQGNKELIGILLRYNPGLKV